MFLVRRTLLWGVMCLFLTFGSPALALEIVKTGTKYTYEMMQADILQLSERYGDLVNYQVIGESEYGRGIYAVSLGYGDAIVLIDAGRHAREWIGTMVAMEMIEVYAHAYENAWNVGGYNVREILDNTTIWFVPMANPDGVTLQQKGLSEFPEEAHADLIKMNNGSKDFTRWKANAKGVDLNRNYPVIYWELVRNDPGKPYFQNFKGDYPLQAKEAVVTAKFTQAIDPQVLVTYHSSGNVIYWWYYHSQPELVERDKRMARKIAEYTGYGLMPKEEFLGSGSYRDWYHQNTGNPGFTIELGNYIPAGHVPVSEFPSIWERNKLIGLYVAKEGYNLYRDKYLTAVAIPSVYEMEVNGEKTAVPSYNIEGYNYINLRDLAVLFRDTETPFDVEWDAGEQVVNIVPERRYTLASRGALVNERAKAVKVALTIKYNGEQVAVSAYTVNGATYYKLRDIASLLGITID